MATIAIVGPAVTRATALIFGRGIRDDDLWALSVSDRKPYLMLGETFNEWAGVFSADMRWVAYVSLETDAAAHV